MDVETRSTVNTWVTEHFPVLEGESLPGQLFPTQPPGTELGSPHTRLMAPPPYSPTPINGSAPNSRSPSPGRPQIIVTPDSSRVLGQEPPPPYEELCTSNAGPWGSDAERDESTPPPAYSDVVDEV